MKEKPTAVRFVSVYRISTREKILYGLLKERPAYMNISHNHLPSFAGHCRFVRSKPYKEWYFIKKEGNLVGSIYLSLLNEIGIFLFKEFCGSGLEKEALQIFIAKRHRSRLLANVSPKNKAYTRLFQGLGFKHIQNSYCLKPEQRLR